MDIRQIINLGYAMLDTSWDRLRQCLTEVSYPKGCRVLESGKVEKPRDCNTPIDYDQLYALLKYELTQGARSWFNKEEEAAIQHSNRRFCRVTPACCPPQTSTRC